MELLEKDLEHLIMTTPMSELMKRGLFITGHRIKQITLGNYGRFDIVTVSKISHEYYDIRVYELKKDKIDPLAFWQAARYMAGIRHWLSVYRPNYVINVSIALIGSYIDASTGIGYLPDIFPEINLYTYDYRYDGIWFKGSRGFTLIDHGFTKIK